MMPQATPALAAEWPDMDHEAINHLKASGLTLNRDWSWTKPEGYELTPRDISAINYLCDEWDFAGVRQ